MTNNGRELLAETEHLRRHIDKLVDQLREAGIEPAQLGPMPPPPLRNLSLRHEREINGIKYTFDQRFILGEYAGWFKLWHENGKLRQEFLGKELPVELKDTMI